MTFTNITTAGAGTMGSQVAWQMAFHGKHVTVYDAIAAGLEKGKAFHQEYADTLHQRARRNPRSRSTTPSLGSPTPPTCRPRSRNADLITESVPESLAIKESFWRAASKHAPAHTVFTTNTSTLAPEHAGRLRRSATAVPRASLRHRRLGLEHRRSHGPPRHRPRRLRRTC